MVVLPEGARALVDAGEFATIATLEPDGQAQLSVVWLARDGDDLLISTTKGRRKQVNLERDPRVTVLVYARENPYSYLEVRGRVSVTTEGGRELIDDLARRYTGAERYTGDAPGVQRVVVRVHPEKVVWRG
ncbi:MAG: PPOX class F420-dependent oxidoreductase [Actinomycetes bacterium]